jgi:preprotein translocase subunit SecD
MAGLAFFGATLTLPGIAGIILTIGMAVDANVLIFERIREELRLNKPPRAAIEGGYSKAIVTILDANVTTFIAALVLFQFGTGPVQGFAVTLSIGIVASFITAVFITRVIFDYLFIIRRWKKISI